MPSPRTPSARKNPARDGYDDGASVGHADMIRADMIRGGIIRGGVIRSDIIRVSVIRLRCHWLRNGLSGNWFSAFRMWIYIFGIVEHYLFV